MSTGKAILNSIRQQLNLSDYRKKHWEGSFDEYLDIVRDHPEVTRTAYQRLYDMILSHGTEEVYENKEKITRYKFFTDFAAQHSDAIYGLDRQLMHLVNAFKSAAKGYGTERRVLLLHGPVGSSKSTIARLLKKGLELYSKVDEGMVFAFSWKGETGTWHKCPMHEEPLHLVPSELRTPLLTRLREQIKNSPYEVTIQGDLCPFCRQMYNERVAKYDGDWHRMLDEVKVYRLILSEQDRIGIGTFQPKDEKNQDSTELTGDINYRKIAEYGTDSDPRCVAGDTVLATGEGLQEMGRLLPCEMPDDTFVPHRMTVSTIGRNRVATANSVYFGGRHPLCTLETRLGYRLSGTPNHMMLTMTEDGEPAWKEMRLLREGEYVALGRGIHTWAAEDMKLPAWEPTRYGNERHLPVFPQRMTPRLAYFIGLWVGDGHFYLNPEDHQYELGWTQLESDRQVMFARLVEELFGIQVRITHPAGHAGMVVVGCRNLVQGLQQVLGLKAGAHHKAIPDCVLRSTRGTVLACLQGLWETDGTIRANGSNWAMFATCSETLARQVHTLLLAFGIVSSLKKAPSDWEVRVYGQNVNRLVELVPALRGRFTVGAETFVKPLPNVDVVPFIKPKLRTIYQKASNREALKRRYSGSLHGATKPNTSYALLEDFLAAAQTEDTEALRLVAQMRHLLEQRYVWLPIASLAQAGESRVYDVSVTPTHAYWANGFVSHNCFNFDGELNIANRGLVEFIEVLKLDVAFLYDLLGASQEHKIKPKKFAQTDIDEVILGHSVAGNTPIPYRHDGVAGWTTLEQLHARFAADSSGLEVLAYDFDVKRSAWTRVKAVFRHPFTGNLLTTSQNWGAVETTPNHSIYDRNGEAFYPEDRHEIMALRRLDEAFTPEPGVPMVIDIIERMEIFVRDEAAVTAARSRVAGTCPEGWARLKSSHAEAAIRVDYDPVCDIDPFQDLLTVLLWYAAAGQVNDRDDGVVISHADHEQLVRVRAAYSRICNGASSLDTPTGNSSRCRLHLGSEAIARIAEHHCGRDELSKRLPDFLFQLSPLTLHQAVRELLVAQNSWRQSEICERTNIFEFEFASPLLAAQVGTLASILDWDYDVSRNLPGQNPAYRIRWVPGEGKRGRQRQTSEVRLHSRSVQNEWVYDIECVGLHNFVCGVGNVVAHNTNEPEYRRLQNNEFMEALRDRTVKIDVPYVSRLKDEVKIYEKDFNAERVKGKHIAPHTIEIAAMWAVLTRLVPPKHANLTLLQKLKLYNGKTLPGFTEDNVVELKREALAEGMHGISPRYIQDKISNALVAHPEEGCVNPFMVLHELETGLRHHSLITSQEQMQHYKELLSVVKEEYEDIVKNEVQRAIAADEDALTRLCSNYIDNVKAYTQREKVRNRYTGNYEDPDERLMRSVEEKIDIPEGRKDDFRREIMNYIGALAIDGKRFDYKTNERLQKALELKLFEDQKDTIKLTSLVSSVVDKATQEKIDVVKSRLIRNYGYCDVCSTDVLSFVASIFARGHTKK